MKRIISCVLAAIVVLAMSLTAFAAESYSITVTNTSDTMSIVGKKYTAYKLFDLKYDDNKTTYSYTIKTDNPFYSTAAAKAVLDEYFDFRDIASDAATKTVLVKEAKKDATTKTLSGDDVRKLANALEPYAKGDGAGSATATAESVKIDLTEAGYYIVTGTVKPTDPADSTKEVVSAIILDNADPDATVKPKAGVPTIDKKIIEAAEGEILDSEGQAAVAKVGSTISYQIDSIVPDLTGYSKYTFKIGDAISEGLTYDKNSFALTINGTTETISPVFASDDKSFTLTIPFGTLKKYAKDDKIVLTYDTKVNDKALEYDYENNTAKLTYSKSPYTDEENETPEKKTYVLDLNMDLEKIANGDSTQKLDGAQFKLYRVKADKTEEYYKWDATNKVVSWTDIDNADVFETDKNGNLTQQVRGLDKGTYYLLETKAPQGFNQLKDPVEVVISVQKDDDTVTYSATYGGETADVTNGTVDISKVRTSDQPVAIGNISNESGVELPATGGMGTTIFYVLGSILVIGAGLLLVTKRRMNAR